MNCATPLHSSAAPVIKKMTLLQLGYEAVVVDPDGSSHRAHFPLGLSIQNDQRLHAMAAFVAVGGEIEVEP